ncbi:hypothetical protein EOA78_28905 [Mesorhizobium sp. M5C.F.Cr.IN.023.01.1.1]|uniref:hypothetical protein n=1 Tax=Mesorhizobium sp. M5C.F.Cr.IN.023.01.1.1 TaxID=2496768 RepID=UPI000FCCAACD|nr:hypothetical protein [Mesorhizobium sp. M5C.F.Cr.IN.023.01.1.1]RUV67786.1 hypothetical protein EOA78_28905 [Mesorhizobium sp. M5C.F.Cr.IN.023.01.1.1]
MPREQSFTFYTYSPSGSRDENRWADTGIRDVFFDDEVVARQAVRQLRNDVTTETDEEWSKMYIEKIETFPMTKDNILALLNEGVGAIVKNHEVVGTIE